MSNRDYGYFGTGSTGYAHYKTAFDRNFGGSGGSGGSGGGKKPGGGEDGCGCGCLSCIVVAFLFLAALFSR